jgi:hypothetical protein
MSNAGTYRGHADTILIAIGEELMRALATWSKVLIA